MRRSEVKRSKINLNGKSNADLISKFVAEEVYEERLSKFEEVTVPKPKNLKLILGIISLIAVILIGIVVFVVFILNRPEPPIVFAKESPSVESQTLAAPEEIDYDHATDLVLTGNKLSSINVKAVYSFSPELSKVFATKSPDQQFPIASLTKVMTAVASEDVFSTDDLVCVKEETRLYGSLDLVKDDCFARDDLLVHMLVSSSNDAAEQLRLNSLDRGIDLIAYMNARAKIYNLKNTKYANTIGLDDTNNYSSAKNVAMIFSVLAKNSDLTDQLKSQQATLRSQNSDNIYKYETTNELLKERSEVIAGKTGFTADAGGTLVVLTKKPRWDFTIITVILGAESSESRFEEMGKLLDLIYSEFDL